jgi:hypothetical protein
MCSRTLISVKVYFLQLHYKIYIISSSITEGKDPVGNLIGRCENGSTVIEILDNEC